MKTLYDYEIIEANSAIELVKEIRRISPIEIIGGAFSFNGKICQAITVNTKAIKAGEQDTINSETVHYDSKK